MPLIASDLLADACGLSLGMTLLTSGIGLMLWLFGWWGHRFWAVLLVTVVAGLFGLTHGAALPSPLLSALLIALAAGMLALALVRVLAFVAAGLTGILFAQEFLPELQQQVLVFLIVGLVCLFLYRHCLMLLTSMAGAVLMTYASLVLLHGYGGLDTVAMCEQKGPLVSGACALVALLGYGFQVCHHRRVLRRARHDEGEYGSRSLLNPVRLLGRRHAA